MGVALLEYIKYVFTHTRTLLILLDVKEIHWSFLNLIFGFGKIAGGILS